jgi:ABC-2 type transport system permease protein
VSSDRAVAAWSFRRVRTTAVVWALVFGATIASSALTYASTYPTTASRRRLAAVVGVDPGLSVLLGPVRDIGTVGGYTVYKCYVTLTCIGAIWALLATTRLLRGEEDTGRWQLVVAGPLRPSRATLATLVGIAGGVAVLVVGATAFTLLVGTDGRLAFSADETLLYGASLGIAPAVFVGVGALTAQLARTRRVANTLGMTVFAVGVALRMLADSGPSTRWLLWTTPFGWTERMRPFTAPDPRPLVAAAVVTTILVVAGWMLARRRDVGDGVVVATDRAAMRRFGLSSPGAFVVREQLGSIAAWLIGVFVGAVCLGVVAKAVNHALSGASVRVIRRFGVAGTLVQDYFGIAFLLLAATIALVPAPQLTSAAEDDDEGRLGLLLALPVARRRHFATRVALAFGTATMSAVLAGAGAWIGAASQGIDVGLGTLLGAGLNVVPVAAVVLGIGALMLALIPRAAAPVVYAVVVACLVVDFVASLVTSTHWLERASLFHYMALAPAKPVDAVATSILLVIATALMVAATEVFARRAVRAS